MTKKEITPVGRALTQLSTFLDDYFDTVALTGGRGSDRQIMSVMALCAICYRKRFSHLGSVPSYLENEGLRKPIVNALSVTGPKLLALTEIISFIRPVPELWIHKSDTQNFMFKEYFRILHKARCDLIMWYVTKRWGVQFSPHIGSTNPSSVLFDLPLWKPSKMHYFVVFDLLGCITDGNASVRPFLEKLQTHRPNLLTPYRHRPWSEADVPARLKNKPVWNF